MYPDNFNGYSFEQLTWWRTKILADLQQAEEQAIDAGIDPEELKIILSKGIALGKVESKIDLLRNRRRRVK
ncbi:hypothetical protein [Leptolyngbya sp. FACHB-261]|uniref:hypothetical protein n=1 Tax=Leptolyngbya sp. FACHB-261 TaxID=2692806 RepID=UPI001686A102|nr:hypothetical protein [Leptolyngbya sp. FACHB-261]MBD2100976.1 hypothetical protein [Leptolyngbya sp. FACHB-261]